MQVREAQIPRELDNGTIGCLVQESMLATENKKIMVQVKQYCLLGEGVNT